MINRAPAGHAADYSELDGDNGIGRDYVPVVGTGIDDPLVFAFKVVGEQANRLLAAAPPERAACQFAVLTGLRRSELQALRWGDFTSTHQRLSCSFGLT